jgi:hypothetical protein
MVGSCKDERPASATRGEDVRFWDSRFGDVFKKKAAKRNSIANNQR